MKRKLTLIFVAILAFSFFITPCAFAGYKVRTCEVEKALTDDVGNVLISFTIVGTTKTNSFYVPAGQEKTMLAVALTAITSDITVEALLDFYEPGTEIGYITLVK